MYSSIMSGLVSLIRLSMKKDRSCSNVPLANTTPFDAISLLHLGFEDIDMFQY